VFCITYTRYPHIVVSPRRVMRMVYLTSNSYFPYGVNTSDASQGIHGQIMIVTLYSFQKVPFT
jgi:hypothetical protein